MNIRNISHWLDFSEAAWSAAGRPEGLRPSVVETNPIEYDLAYYEYFEQRFFENWLNLSRQIHPEDGTLISLESLEFREAWRRNFSWQTTWKQLLPLFIYGAALGVDNTVLVQFAAYYCVAQAVPSMVIDRALDEGTGATSASDATFCLIAYIKGLDGIHALQGAVSTEIEECFFSLTREMYTSMLTEHSRRFVLPQLALSEAIRNYFAPSSRLLSSVFFGILPIWAYALADKQIPASMHESFNALRMVRQLNDELSDIYIDLARGLVSLPWLYAIEEAPEMRELIASFWREPENASAQSACRACLRKTRGIQRAHGESLHLLSLGMDAIREHFRPADAFELTAMVNVRWAHLMRMAQNDFEDVPPPRQPKDPRSVLISKSNAIVPVGGAGAVVVDSDGKVLMSLVLKRGMVRWELPAGVAKDGESMEEAAIRETLEETGINVRVEDVLALCWHYSRDLGKGWMGTFFRAYRAEDRPTGAFHILKQSALTLNKVNFLTHPELFHPVDIETCDFDQIHHMFDSIGLRPTAHENILGSGFVDWTKIPTGRIHPLHRGLLEARTNNKKVGLLVRDADTDWEAYDGQAKLYRARPAFV